MTLVVVQLLGLFLFQIHITVAHCIVALQTTAVDQRWSVTQGNQLNSKPSHTRILSTYVVFGPIMTFYNASFSFEPQAVFYSLFAQLNML